MTTRARALIALAGAALPASAQAQCTQSWNRRPPSPPLTARTMVVHDDGTGPALYAGGDGLAKWNGDVWTTIPVSGPFFRIRALASYDDDGPGPHPAALYAGGAFTAIGGVPIVNFARWDGSNWSAVAPVNGTVTSFATAAEDPSGPLVLYVGGEFVEIAGVAATRIARWDGDTWSALGTGLSNAPLTLATLDPDGAGPQTPILFVAGSLSQAGGIGVSNIAQWNGQTWAPLGSGIGSMVTSLSIFDDDGPGPHPEALYAGGRYDRAGNVAAHCIAKWDGTDWSGLNGGTGIHDEYVTSTLAWDSDGPGPGFTALYVGGVFGMIGGVPAYRLAKWDGSQWSDAGLEDPSFEAGEVLALATFDDATRPSIFASGDFYNTSFTESWTMVRWGCPLPCYANCDGSTAPPALNVLDFNCFVNRYSAGDSYANCDGSSAAPVLNILDFNCFVNRYTAGCP